MKRLIDNYLLEWKNSRLRMPLLIRGARQVGKTYAAVNLGKSFENFVEINLEIDRQVLPIFEKDLRPDRIIRELAALLHKPIIPGKTLLFFDEIQESETVFRSLRYFYELLPSLHVIAAGSLLDFQIEKIGMPVGRVKWIYIYPVSFIEFLYALGYELLAQEILNHSPNEPMSEALHLKALALVGEYLAVGGMPASVKCWRDTKDMIECGELLRTIINTYIRDFDKYAKRSQLKYLDLLFNHIPESLGRKFKYSRVSQKYRKRELEPALTSLVMAGITTQIFASSGQGIPLGAQASREDFKVLFLDVALSQAILGLDLGPWIIDPREQFINKGELVEAFVGQELLAYASPFSERRLYYWHREERASNAEVDYLIQQEGRVVPLEVKSGHGGALQSLKLFLESHLHSSYGIRLAFHNYSKIEKIHTYPLYAIAKVASLTPGKNILKL